MFPLDFKELWYRLSFAGTPSIRRLQNEWRRIRVTVLGHFDGKSIILDDEIDLPRNQLLTLRIEQVNSPTLEEESALSWLASNAVMTDLLPPDLAERHDHFLLTIPTEGDPR